MNFFFVDTFLEDTEGQSFWMTLLIEFITAIFTLIVGLSILRRQMKHDRALQRLEQSNSRREIDRIEREKQISELRYFQVFLKKNVSRYQKVIKDLDAYISRHKGSPHVLSTLFDLATSDFERLTRQDKPSLFDSWCKQVGDTQEQLDRYFSYWENIDYLERARSESRRLYDLQAADNIKLQAIVVEKANKLADDIASTLHELKPEGGPYEADYHKFLNSYLLKYHQLLDGGADLSKLNDEWLEPLVTELVKVYKLERNANDLSQDIRQIRVQLYAMQVDISHYLDQLGLVSKGMKKRLEALKDAVDFLANKEL